MRTPSLILLMALALGCGGSDITDDPQIDLDAISNIDAPPGTPDADPSTPDADPSTPDASTVDAPPGTPDAPPSPDASEDRAQIFCDRYDTLCGYDPMAMNRFDDEAECLLAFDGFSAGQQTCVENQLDQLESDEDLAHCRSAMGRPPCN